MEIKGHPPAARRRQAIYRWARRGLRRALIKAAALIPPSLLRRARNLGREATAASAEARTSKVLSLSYGGTRFDLDVVGEGSWVGGPYSRWADGIQVFELVMLECLTRLLRQTEEPRFMDIGAFMGHYACYAAALLRDREETYAVESNPQYYAGILRSIELNGFSKLRPFNAVLSDRIEDAAIEGPTVRLADGPGKLHQTVTLDELCRRERIHPKVVKIDVHGSEGKVLMGMQEVSRSIEYILLELHPKEVLSEYSGDIDSDDILSLLWRLGFHVFHMAGHRYRAGGGELERVLQEGFAYRRLDSQAAHLLLFDRSSDVFLLCSKAPDLERVLGPSVPDPGLTSDVW